MHAPIEPGEPGIPALKNEASDSVDLQTAEALSALEAGDGAALWRLFPDLSIPTRQLRARHVPDSPDWGYGTSAEAFALTFDGYAWGESQPVPLDPRELPKRIEQATDLSGWSADALRAALFGIQRIYRDSPSAADRALVERILTALRNALSR